MNVPYYTPELARSTVEPESIAENCHELSDIFNDIDFQAELDNGNVTIALLRPALDEDSSLCGTDPEVAERLEEEITGLGVIAKFSMNFDSQAVNEFYEGTPKDVQSNKLPDRHEGRFETRWDEFVGLMTEGTTTVLLLHSPSGDAPQLWRRQVGHWNIEENRDLSTLRGKYGTDNYNNLLHGSDSPEAVVRELGIIERCLNRQTREHEVDIEDSSDSSGENNIEKYLGTKTFELLGIVDGSSIEVIDFWRRGGSETYVTDFIVHEGDDARHLIAKACIKPLSTEVVNEWLARREILSQAGVQTPELIAADNGMVIEEFIPFSLKEVYESADQDGKMALRDNFIRTYNLVLSAGFVNPNLHDVRSRGNDVVIIDVGEDIGGAGQAPSETIEANQTAGQQLLNIVS